MLVIIVAIIAYKANDYIILGKNKTINLVINNKNVTLNLKKDIFIEDDEIINKIKKVELSDVIMTAEKYLKLSEMSFTAVGRVKTESEYRRILENSIG